MSEKNPYREWLKEDYGKIIDSLEINDQQKHFMRSRWLDQVLWMEGKSDSSQVNENMKKEEKSENKNIILVRPPAL